MSGNRFNLKNDLEKLFFHQIDTNIIPKSSELIDVVFSNK
ncbi:hypothetical protein Nos7524_1872 [Nostoc sp. PCC 7524]|nr:hypothetical protein Nos7524_1872 [Nostoc sp. PCC 7524]